MIDEIHDEPAFPCPSCEGGNRQEGMTLRDYFAGQALVGLMSKDPYAPREEHTWWAYQMADAMLARRAES